MRFRRAGLWHHADFMRLWIGQSVSMFGSTVTREAFGYVAILYLQATPFQLGLLGAIRGVPVLLTGLAVGVWIDRARRKPILIWTDLVRALLLFSIPAAAALHRLTMVQIFVVAPLLAVLGLLFDTAYQAYLPSVVQREELLEGNTKLGISASIAEVAGPPTGGVLVQLVAAPFALLLDAISFLVSAWSLHKIRAVEAKPVSEEAHEDLRAAVTAGLRITRTNPVLRGLMLAAAIASVSGGFFGTLYGLYALRVLHIPPGLLGVVVGLGGIGSLVGATQAERLVRRWGIGRVLLTMAVFNAAAALTIPLAHGPVPVATAILALGQLTDVVGTIYLIAEVTLRQTITPPHLLGRVNALRHLVEGTLIPVGALIAGWLSSVIGTRSTLFVAVGGVWLSALMLFLSRLGGVQDVVGAQDSTAVSAMSYTDDETSAL